MSCSNPSKWPSKQAPPNYEGQASKAPSCYVVQGRHNPGIQVICPIIQGKAAAIQGRHVRARRRGYSKKPRQAARSRQGIKAIQGSKSSVHIRRIRVGNRVRQSNATGRGRQAVLRQAGEPANPFQGKLCENPYKQGKAYTARQNLESAKS